MKELMGIDTYSELREALGNELKSQKQGFVRTGYLLKVARDTDVLRESGYSSVAEFAKAEYGLEKDTVSRYIAINDKYSVGGYSDKLEEKYMDFGLAKLQEMLTLPEPVTDLLTPEISKRQLQELKKEIREEEQITDLEVMMEEPQDSMQDMGLLEQMLYQYFHENKHDYVKLSSRLEAIREMDTVADKSRRAAEEILNILAPSGHNILSARIRGVGKILLSIHGADNTIELLNVRSGEKEEISWERLYSVLESVMSSHSGEDGWEAVYGEVFEEEQADAVSQKENISRAETVMAAVEAEKIEELEIEPAETEEKSRVAPVQPEETAAVEESAEIQETLSQKEDIPGTETMTAADIEEYKGILLEEMRDDLESLKKAIFEARWDTVRMWANNIADYAEELEELEE